MHTLLPSFLPFLPIAGILDAFAHSNPAGKAIVFLLLIGSVAAWSIMLTKFNECRRAYDESTLFQAAYRKQEHPFAFYFNRKPCPGGPLAMIYRAVMLGLRDLCERRGINLEEWSGSSEKNVSGLNAPEIKTIRNFAEQAMDEQIIILERNMIVLGTAATAAPFVGLLGTVWGILDAFGGLAIHGSATLSAVAPGICGSLLTTMIGLIVALPSLIGYNMLANRIRIITTMMEHFTDNFTADIERLCARN